MTLKQLLMTMVERGGSELHLLINSPPQLRIDGYLTPLDTPVLEPASLLELVSRGVPADVGLGLAHADRETYVWYEFGLGRFAFSSIRDYAGSPIVIIRHLPTEILGGAELGLPDHIRLSHAGLFLIGGDVQSGRSTIMNAVIDRQNRECHEAIMIFGDATSFLHPHKSSLVTVLPATASVEAVEAAGGLSGVDVVALDGRYDRRDIQALLRASQRGRTVIATHFGRRATTVVRNIVELVPAEDRASALRVLADHLGWIVTVVRIPRRDRKGFVVVHEFLNVTDEVRQMLAAARYDNVEKLLEQDDPYSLQKSLPKSVRQVLLSRRVSKETAELYTGCRL